MLAKLKKEVIFAGAAFCIFTLPVIAHIILHPASFQWDFKRYYFTGKLSLLGANPYDVGKMVSLFGDQLCIKQSFIYPPYALLLLRPMAYYLSLTQAYYLFFALKLILYVLLIVMWKRTFFRDTSAPCLVLFALASMGAFAAYMDLYSGNISVFQQVFFWAGIACLLKRNIMMSGVCIVCASSMKFFFIGPLLLLLLAAGYWRHFLLFAGMLAALVASACLESPAYFDVIKNNIQHSALKELGHCAVSIRSFLYDLFSVFQSLNVCNPDILYGTMATCIAAYTLYVIIRNLSFLRQEMFLLVNFTIVSYCTVVPLLKDYEQVIVIPPTYFLWDYFRRREHRLIGFLLVLLYFVLTQNVLLPIITYFEKITGWTMSGSVVAGMMYLLLNYHVLFALCITWGLYLFVIEKENKRSIACPQDTKGDPSWKIDSM